MKRLNKKWIYKIILLAILIIIGLILYYYKKEQEKIKNDEYNFNNIETIKSILGSVDNNFIQLNTLGKINNYTTKVYPDIIPIKNCYFIKTNSIYNTTQDSNIKFIVGFSLESYKYKTKYNKDYYLYPENYKFNESDYKGFINTISKIV